MTDLNEKNLSMFFDPEFNVTSYVDALLNSLFGSEQLLDKVYNKDSLQRVSHSCNKLIAHLDYYAGELTSDLNTRIDQLQYNSTMIAKANALQADFDEDDSVFLNTITRLQYLVDSFSNSITLLQNDFKDAQDVLEANSAALMQSVQSLNDLKIIKRNLSIVISVFEKVNALSEKPDAITTEDFEKSLDTLYKLVKNEINAVQPESRSSIVDKIEDMISLLPVFRGYTNYYPTYKKFANDLKNLKATNP